MTDTGPDRSAPLQFETDRGASRSFWIACLILVAIVLWMGSGLVLPEPESPAKEAAAEAPPPPSVRVRESRAEPVTLRFGAEGEAQPERDATVRAEASGRVVGRPVDKGDRVARGDVLLRLSSEAADADLAEAEEAQARASREFDNASRLLERGVATADRVAEARAALAAAEARVTEAEEARADLTVTAPFDGRVEALEVTEGESVVAGDTLARVVDTDPLTVAIQVPQQSLARIETGQAAEVRFITGQVREGTLTFVGSAAASETRTFLAEIEVPNPDGEIPAGVSAEVTIPTGTTEAHLVPPSIVSLDPDGAIGVKTVEDGRVRFHAIEIVRSELGGVYVTGLPETARIITIGQGFVRDGEAVRASSEDKGESQTESAEASR